ncbi:unnamed protein product [Cyprideis torosa]|uniref:Uncharacterized protein n=1 Tax=Cyprideis torosa TaxID=163714 RepID=A0A7R8ZR11_9CRUS|nr:unnamed protein product [Cyprideis torosa]CAG0897738.1 unnamed protein product [Cyprideis torosa]
MVRAHKQAWVWQDEWVDLTMEDIREIERETQEVLAKRMGATEEENKTLEESEREESDGAEIGPSGDGPSILVSASSSLAASSERRDSKKRVSIADGTLDSSNCSERRRHFRKTSSKESARAQQLQAQAAVFARMESLARDSENSDSGDDEFFDAKAEVQSETSSLHKWSSMELIPEELDQSPVSSPKLRKERAPPPLGAGPSQSSSNHSPLRIKCPPLQKTSFDRHDSLFRSGYYPSTPPLHHPSRVFSVGSDSDEPHASTCPTTVLLLVFHGGNVLDNSGDVNAKASDVKTFQGSFETVIRQHYLTIAGRLAIRLVPCPVISQDALRVFSNLSPYSFDVSPSTVDGSPPVTHDAVPIGALPLFAAYQADYWEVVNKVVHSANAVYHDFLRSEEGADFCGTICAVADSLGSLLLYDALSSPLYQVGDVTSENVRTLATALPEAVTDRDPSPAEARSPAKGVSDNVTACPAKGVSDNVTACSTPTSKKTSATLTPADEVDRKASTSSADSGKVRQSHPILLREHSTSSPIVNLFDFDVSEVFLLGSPLPLLIAFRKIAQLDPEDREAPPERPFCQQVYNLFYPTDSLAVRLEPLISARFAALPPLAVPRYCKYPLGDGAPTHFVEYVQSNPFLFSDTSSSSPQLPFRGGRKASECPAHNRDVSLPVSAPPHGNPPLSLLSLTSLAKKWWGHKRLDYALYCPDGLNNFPAHALPHILHAAMWESQDVAAFILRQLQVGQSDLLHYSVDGGDYQSKSLTLVPPLPRTSCWANQAREKWQKKRTSVKLRNVSANHRANDVIVGERQPQILTARFMYGPLDMVALSGEKVDVYVLTDSHSAASTGQGGEWKNMGTGVTDKTGRIVFQLSQEQELGFGVYPVKMVVRGDLTSVDFHLAVVPSGTECVVFSVDGSFTASVSVTGKDPKVRAGAVDVVRYWQELGYLIIYITGRPDMQQRRVVSWLAQHNFPHGLVSFADGLSPEFLSHKAEYMTRLVKDCGLKIHAAYGSSKDISVYASAGLDASQIYIVGRSSKKHLNMAVVLSEGYAAHLSALQLPGGSRPAQGNGRMLIPKGYFSLPGQGAGALQRRRSRRRTLSLHNSGNAAPDEPGGSASPPAAVKLPHPHRGFSPLTRRFTRK